MKITPRKNTDPAELGFPPTLPLELALREKTPAELCEAYGLSHEDWDRLRQDPLFIKAVKEYVEELKQDGMSFKLKARMQAEVLLNTSFRLIHAHNDDVPPNVKADLIKFTIRAAGLDGSKDPAQQGATGPAFNIQINLG